MKASLHIYVWKCIHLDRIISHVFPCHICGLCGFFSLPRSFSFRCCHLFCLNWCVCMPTFIWFSTNQTVWKKDILIHIWERENKICSKIPNSGNGIKKNTQKGYKTKNTKTNCVKHLKKSLFRLIFACSDFFCSRIYSHVFITCSFCTQWL